MRENIESRLTRLEALVAATAAPARRRAKSA